MKWNRTITTRTRTRTRISSSLVWFRFLFVSLLVVLFLSLSLWIWTHHCILTTIHQRDEKNVKNPKSFSDSYPRQNQNQQQQQKEKKIKESMDIQRAIQNRIDREQLPPDSFVTHARLVMNQIPEKYKAAPTWTHFPDISIIGAPKAGTSQLYQILSHHVNTRPFHPSMKEYCMDNKQYLNYTAPNEELYSSLFHFHEQMQMQNENFQTWTNNHAVHDHDDNSTTATTTTTTTTRSTAVQTVNGCINPYEVVYHILYLQQQATNTTVENTTTTTTTTTHLRTKNKKFIFLFRDPADYLFSFYNFFALQEFDITNGQKRWAFPSKDYRSPELFHELIVSGNSSIHGTYYLHQLQLFFLVAKRMLDLVGPENILFLRNEDMLPQQIETKGGLLDQLAIFTQLNRSQFDPEFLHSKTNCNTDDSSRGMNTKCTMNRTDSSKNVVSYPISGHRGMLSQTRKMIYILAAKECILWKQYFHIVYEDCIQEYFPMQESIE